MTKPSSWLSRFNDLEGIDRDSLKRQLLADNLRRGRTLAIVVVVLEAAFAAATLLTSALKVDGRFQFSHYLAMYLLMIIVNLSFYSYTGRVRDASELPAGRVSALERLLGFYVAFILCWGSVISLMDQELYGHLMAFMVNMIICSVVLSMQSRKLLPAFLLSTAVVAAGLPFFQKSGDVLIGHYANLFCFVVVLWVASRINYQRYCTDFKSKWLLNQANSQLEVEIERNRAINLQLAAANRQLSELSLLDELTGLANRRSFRCFVDRVLETPDMEGRPFSVAMIDMDSFKEYNDTYGHSEGDQAIVAIAGVIRAAARQDDDIVARWGGDEFVYAAFNMDGQALHAVVSAIHGGVLRLGISHEHSTAGGTVSVSIGCCTTSVRERGDISRCIERADRAMYRAKAAGRNRIEPSVVL